jgi:outer membrane lipoprotein carrier protein
MKYFLSLSLLFTLSFATLVEIDSFQADFKQIVTDDKGAKLLYSGRIKAMRPQYALWEYLRPVNKSIYVVGRKIIVIEPEIEQAIIRNAPYDFDFFKILKSAKKVSENSYETFVEENEYIIKTDKNLISSISYKDEFDNSVEIIFDNQKQNASLSKKDFAPFIPKDYDVIRE